MRQLISILFPTLEMNELIRKNTELTQKENPNIDFEVLMSSAKGYASARNELLYKAKGELLFWLDSDIELTSNPLPTLLSILKKGDDIAGAMPSIEFSSGSWIEKFNKLFFEWPYRNVRERDAFERFFDCALYKREPLLAVGGFDERFNKGKEDMDIAIRLWKKQYRMVWTGDIKVKHSLRAQEHFDKIGRYESSNPVLYQKYPTFNFDAFNKKAKGNQLAGLAWIILNSGLYLPLLPVYYLLRRIYFKFGAR